MHWNYNFWINLPNYFLRRSRINCIFSSNRNHQNINCANFINLLVGKQFLAQISQMAKAHFFSFYYIYGIWTSFFAIDIIVKRWNSLYKNPLNFIFTGPFNQKRLAFYGFYI